MWLGRHQLGTYLDVLFQAKDVDGVPTLPAAVPAIQVRQASDGAVVYTGLMPINDKTVTPGLFRLPLFLGDDFTSGQHTLRLSCVAAGHPNLDVRSFYILPGGNVRGQVLGMAYFHKPHADFVVYQSESGQIVSGKNPRLA